MMYDRCDAIVGMRMCDDGHRRHLLWKTTNAPFFSSIHISGRNDYNCLNAYYRLITSAATAVWIAKRRIGWEGAAAVGRHPVELMRGKEGGGRDVFDPTSLTPSEGDLLSACPGASVSEGAAIIPAHPSHLDLRCILLLPWRSIHLK